MKFNLKIVFFSWVFLFTDAKDVMTKAQREYLSVFKTMPRLFEYLLETLEQRPEVLEKNDVTIFKREVNNENFVTDFEKQEVDGYKDATTDRSDDTGDKDDETDQDYNNDDTYHDDDVLQDDEGDGDGDDHPEFEQRQKSSPDIAVDDYDDDEDLLYNNPDNKDLDNAAEKEGFYDWLDDESLLFQGSDAGRSALTSEEVAEQALKVEQMLEEYNSDE